MTVKEIFDTFLPGRMDAEKARRINAVYQFHVTGPEAGEWYLDATRPSAWVAAGVAPNPGCTLTLDGADWVALATGKLRPEMAMMTGKVKLEGDLFLAMRLKEILG